MSYPYKQVLIWRGDLKCRKGKIVSQLCHASISAIMSLGKWGAGYTNFYMEPKEPVRKWFEGSFAKIALYCKDETELIDLYNKALEAKIPCALITDNGTTEFHGVHTKTAVAIGPWDSDVINKITSHLPLL